MEGRGLALLGVTLAAVVGWWMLQRRRRGAWRRVRGIAELCGDYDGFVLDAYGVLRDADRALPGALACVKALVAAGKRLAVVSNSTALDQGEQLAALGIDPALFSAVVTSGTMAFPRLREGAFGRRCVLFCWRPEDKKKDLEAMAGLTIAGIEEADFVLAQGSRLIRSTPAAAKGEGDLGVDEVHFRDEWPDAADALLRRGVERGLRLVCLNPDVVSVQPDGKLKYQAGAVAKRYESFGGEVLYFGKPNADIFEEAVAAMGVPKARVAHVGDSLHHDVVGAANAGIASVFIASGIHSELLGVDLSSGNGDLEEWTLHRLFCYEKVTPTVVSLHFRWQ